MGIILSALTGAGEGAIGAMDQQQQRDSQLALQTNSANLQLRNDQSLLATKQALADAVRLTILNGGSYADAVNAASRVMSGGSAAPSGASSATPAGASAGPQTAQSDSASGASMPSAPSGSVMSSAAAGSPAAVPAGGVPAFSSGGNASLDIPTLARKYSIPEEALRYDIAMNGGQGVAKMVFEASEGKKTVVNGNVVDLRTAQTGLVDGQVFTDSNGHTIVVNKGPDGKPVVSVPAGALDAQAAQAGVAAGVKAATTPIKVYNPATKREEFTTEANVIGAKPQGGMTGNFYGNPTDVQMAISNIADPQERANAQAAFEDQMRRQRGNLAAGPSASEAAAAKGAETFATGQGKNASDYVNSLNERVRQGGELNMRLQEQLGAMQKFNAGAGTERWAQLAQVAQALDLPQSLVNRLGSGDLSAVQEFQKLSAQTAMESLKQAMGGSGRITQAEFKVFQANNPNVDMDPNAIRKIFDFSTRIYGRDIAEQKAFNAFLDNGGDPSRFPAAWTQMSTQLGFTNPALTAQSPAPTLAAPSNAGAASGVWGIRPIPR